MADGFESILITVPNRQSAAQELTHMMGLPAVEARRLDRPVSRIFLANTCLELREADVDSATISGLVLRDAAASAPLTSVKNPLGLDIQLSNADRALQTENLPQLSVDHVVLRTSNADACIDLFAERLGIRLALDKTVPEWGGRMLFFRAGKVTLEVIQSDSDEPSDDFFWGIALQTPDIDAFCAALADRQVQCSDIRDGRKPDTRVASLKSHTLGIPALLIEPVAN